MSGVSLSGCFGLVLLGGLLLGAFPAEAVQEKACSGADTPEACQYVPASGEALPALTKSKGIRLRAGAEDVLFNSYADKVPAYYISNSGSQDLFVPQGSEEEYRSFINTLTNKKLNELQYFSAIPPTQYAATPVQAANCFFPPDSQSVKVPGEEAKDSPLTVAGFTKLDASWLTNPLAYQAPAQQAKFYYDPYHCSQDDEKNRACALLHYTNYRDFKFSVQSKNGTLQWNLSNPSVSDKITRSVNNGKEEEVTDCLESQAPLLNGACGPNNGANLVQAPSTGLCSRGDAGDVGAYYTAYGIRWGWTCFDVKGTATGIENYRLGTGQGCGACQDRAKQEIGACSASCGGGQQTVTWFDGCGNVQVQYKQDCNQGACYSNATTEVSTNMHPYGEVVFSPVLYYAGTGPSTVSVSGQGSPSFTISGGGWTTSSTIWPGQSLQMKATAANADAYTEQVLLTTGSHQLTWYLKTANATIIYATYWGSGPDSCTSGHGNTCTNFFSCDSNHMVWCRVGTDCSKELVAPNPGECNCNDTLHYQLGTSAGSTWTSAYARNRCSDWSPLGLGLVPYPGSGYMEYQSGKLLL